MKAFKNQNKKVLNFYMCMKNEIGKKNILGVHN